MSHKSWYLCAHVAYELDERYLSVSFRYVVVLTKRGINPLIKCICTIMINVLHLFCQVCMCDALGAEGLVLLIDEKIYIKLEKVTAKTGLNLR